MGECKIAIPLIEDTNIKEFMELLKNNKLDAQYRDFTEILGYVSDIESKLKSALGEVIKLEKRVNQMENKQFKNVCMKMVSNLKSTIREAFAKLGEIKTAIVEGAKNAVIAFKEKGISALNAVMKFFKIKDGLNSMRESVNKSIVSANTAINKIEQISSEIHAAGSHRRNIFRIMANKETKDDIKSNGNVMKVIQVPFKAVKAIMSGTKNVILMATAKLENLDKAVQMNKEKKPSLLAEIKNFKAPEKMTEVDRSKKRDTALE